jgi:hypothetical protein
LNSLLLGFLASLAQINIAIEDNTAVAVFAESTQHVQQVLVEVDSRATPIIFLDGLYIEPLTGKYIYREAVTQQLRQAISSSGHIGRVVLAFDEPCWKGRQTGQECGEIIELMSYIKASLPNTIEWMHINSFAELYFQYQENNGKLSLWYEADHLGFNCYGPMTRCSTHPDVPKLDQRVYIDAMINAIDNAGSYAKIFLVAGAFQSPAFPSFTEQEVILQLHDYRWIAENQYRDKISGIGIFTCSDIPEGGVIHRGACNNERLFAHAQEALEIK